MYPALITTSDTEMKSGKECWVLEMLFCMPRSPVNADSIPVLWEKEAKQNVELPQFQLPAPVRALVITAYSIYKRYDYSLINSLKQRRLQLASKLKGKKALSKKKGKVDLTDE